MAGAALEHSRSILDVGVPCVRYCGTHLIFLLLLLCSNARVLGGGGSSQRSREIEESSGWDGGKMLCVSPLHARANGHHFSLRSRSIFARLTIEYGGGVPSRFSHVTPSVLLQVLVALQDFEAASRSFRPCLSQKRIMNRQS